jgi:hypothetical protein
MNILVFYAEPFAPRDESFSRAVAPAIVGSTLYLYMYPNFYAELSEGAVRQDEITAHGRWL